MKLIIADVTVELNFLSSKLQLPASYRPFIHDTTTRVVDFTIDCQTEIPDELAKSKVIFQANHSLAQNDSGTFWQIRQLNNKILFAFGDLWTKQFPVVVAYQDQASNKWKLYTNSTNPFPTPAGEILTFHLLSQKGRIAMHSSCVDYKGKAYLFTGFSGVGKSTMANLWLRKGATVINDDRIYLQKTKNGYIASNSPMHYMDKPKSAKLAGIFLLKQAPQNNYKQISGAKAISRVSAHCLQHDYDKNVVSSLLNNVAHLVADVPVFELDVYPDKKILTLIQEIC